MARFAKLDEDNTVLGVHVIDDNKVSDENGVNETIGQNILHKIHGWSKWALTDGHTVNGKYYTHVVASDKHDFIFFIGPKKNFRDLK